MATPEDARKRKGTPGPWEVEDRDERLLIWADGNHDAIAIIGTVAEGADEDAQEKYEEEQRANARLIAAAPAMYEALEGFVRWVDAGYPDGPQAVQEAALKALAFAPEPVE